MRIEDVLNEREKVHGNFSINALYAQEFKQLARESINWRLCTDIQRESVDNILQKVARLLAGDNYYKDHWDDIQGYAKLASNEIEEIESHTESTTVS